MNRTTALFIALIVPAIGWCQAGWWTWMHGSPSPINPIANGTFGTQGVAAPTNDPPRSFNSGEWTDQNGNFWMFGGAQPLPDVLWKFDPATNMWTWMKGPNVANSPGVYGTQGVPSPANYPGSRIQGMFTWTGINNDLWLYGGNGFGSTTAQGFLNDLWRYNITTNEWTWMHGSNMATPFPGGVYGTQGVAAPTNVPPCRREGATAWTDQSGNLWLFGGEIAFTTTGLTNDLWKYDITTNMWTWMRGSNVPNAPGSYGTMGVASPANDPPARRSYTHWVDQAGNLWLFGGDSYSTIYNDLWKYDIATNMWTWVRGSNAPNSTGSYGTKCTPSSTNDPPARTQNKSNWVDQCGNFWMFGGRDNLGNNFNDLWHYNVSANIWTWANGGPGAPTPSHGTMNVPAATNMPEPRSNPMTFTQSNGDLWIFGGNYPPIGNNDLWRFVIDTTCVLWCSPVQPTAGFTASNLSGCAPLTVTFTNTSVQSTSWSWNFGDGGTSTQQNPVHTYTAAGTYTVSLIAFNPPASDTMVIPNYITVYASPTASVVSTQSVSCSGGNNGNAVVAASGGTSPYSYTWSNGATASQISNLTSQNYSVTITDANGCTTTQSVSITQPNALNATLNSTPDTCLQSNGTAAATGSGGTSPYSYNWSNGATTAQISNLTSQIYSVTITDANGCTSSQTITVGTAGSAMANAGSDATILLGSSYQLNGTGGSAYSWAPASGLSNSSSPNPTASPSVTTTYTLWITDASGCSATDEVTLFVEIPCAKGKPVPNAFSPNDDGENDVFCVRYDACIKTFTLRIYNRWGETVFITSNFNDCWDGTFRGERLNTAVFIYSFEAEMNDGSRDRQKGNVSLIR